jgi:predicted ester cyclase
MIKFMPVLLAGLATLSVGCKSTTRSGLHHSVSGDTTSGKSREQLNKEVLLRAHSEVWSKGNLAITKELYDENFVCHYSWGVGWKGVDGLNEKVKNWRSEFPDWRETVQQIVAEGDLVVTRWISTGTYSGLRNPDLAGKKVVIWEMGVHRFKNGKIAEQWGVEDSNAYKEQLGRDIF